MKKLLGIIILSFLFIGSANALDRETCADYSGKANTNYGAKIMWGVCIQESDTSFYNRSKRFKCAQKAARAKTDHAAKVKWFTCINK